MRLKDLNSEVETLLSETGEKTIIISLIKSPKWDSPPQLPRGKGSRMDQRRVVIEHRKREWESFYAPKVESLRAMGINMKGSCISRILTVSGEANILLKALEFSWIESASLNSKVDLIA